MSAAVNFSEAEQRLMQEWVTPTRSEILTAKSLIIATLETSPLSETQLLEELTPMTRYSYGAPAFHVSNGESPMSYLKESDSYFVQPRARNAFISALAELTGDGIVSVAPSLNPAQLPAIGAAQTSRTNPVVLEPPGLRGTLMLVQKRRGYASNDDHKAFDSSEYCNGTRARLATADGRLLLDEALASHRNGQYLGSQFMVGAFMESVWFEAADLVKSSDVQVQAALSRSPFPVISEVLGAMLAFAGNGSQGSYRRSQLEGPSIQLVAVRNAIGHGTITSNTTGNFTEVSSALILISAYRQVELIEQMLVANGL